MKKLFVAVLAVAALASCAQEDVILNNDKAITFGDAYVQNSTKAIYGDKDAENKVIEVQAFQVWGTVTGTAGTVALYEGSNVTRPAGLTGYDSDTAWECNDQRFWTPNCDYAFYAVVDAAENAVKATNGVPTSITYTADGTTDLLYGATTKTTKDPDNAAGLTEPSPALVAFTMQHLLSKVSFKFTNTNTNAAYTYKVTAITVSGAHASGTYTFANAVAANENNGAWGSYNGTMPALSFLKENTPLVLETATVEDDKTVTATTVAPKSFVIIPGEPKLNIAITVETLLNGTKFYSKNYTLKVNQSGEGNITKTFEKNTHYNFVVALEGGKPIDFTIGSVGEFSTPAGNDVTIQ